MPEYMKNVPDIEWPENSYIFTKDREIKKKKKTWIDSENNNPFHQKIERVQKTNGYLLYSILS